MKTLHQYRGYAFTIEFTSEFPEWDVDFPDFPNIITAGSTLVEAIANACEALELHLESLQKLEQPMPAPQYRLALVG